MTSIEAIILGLIQGVTEFLPVSSSGHLILFQKILGFEDLEQFILFDLICHLGTLLAILLILFQEIKQAFIRKDQLFQVICGTLPLFPLVLLLHPIKELFNQVELLGFFFLTTAFILYLGERKTNRMIETKSPYKDALKIGCMQALAIVPGISRSGATISGARILGWHREKAVVFSFLLSIPAILGGIVLETKTFFTNELIDAIGISPIAYAIGFTTAFLAGYLALKLLIRIAIKDKFRVFIWYCITIGLVSLYLFN
ncbi:MAG: undecaprenyl-diphosphate phosphatase [Parachlamydiaceae bacterium]